MRYEICAQTDQGQVRKNNEDALAFDAQTGVCLLADGMGGYNAGEVASHMAVSFLHRELAAWLLNEGNHPSTRAVQRKLDACVNDVNFAIFSTAGANLDYAGMGTTLVAGVFLGSRLVLGHIGDSRCYRLRHQSLAQITKDHSLLQEQIDAGWLTPEQAFSAPHKNLITRALGVEAAVVVEINQHRVEPGDVYLMCTDGLSDIVEHRAIAAVLNASGPLDEKALTLIALANQAGGRDNISVLLVQASEGESEPRLYSGRPGAWPHD
ncbi:MAG: protein phosphatase domain protein [Polaromonas sp.]|nr:protein phosphatase domain protein [Polaromonas sp.]